MRQGAQIAGHTADGDVVQKQDSLMTDTNHQQTGEHQSIIDASQVCVFTFLGADSSGLI